MAHPFSQKMLISFASKFLKEGPDETTRANVPTNFWGRAASSDGREVHGVITGPSVYDLTAETTVAIALAAQEMELAAGYYTASMLVGADFLSHRAGYQVEVSEAAG